MTKRGRTTPITSVRMVLSATKHRRSSRGRSLGTPSYRPCLADNPSGIKPRAASLTRATLVELPWADLFSDCTRDSDPIRQHMG